MTSENFGHGFAEMVKLDIVIAPWLAYMGDTKRVSDSQNNWMHKLANELSVIYRKVKSPWDFADVSNTFREQMYYETLLSTAAYLSNMRLGTLVITDEMILVAQTLIKEFVRQDDGSALLATYARIMFFLDGQVLRYYGQLATDAYLSGQWHRPWLERPLEDDVEFALSHGLFSQHTEQGVTFLRLTESGEQLFQQCKSELEACGYLKQREQLIRTAHFTSMADYEELVEKYTPDIHGARRKLLAWSGIESGMKVLELGCGAGALTLDDGLCELVGEKGQIVATDPSPGMLCRATSKLERRQVDNVQFLQASAERLPFGDNTFDAVTGSLFLHFTDVPKALTEIHRVLKPGGFFTTLYSLDIAREDFLVDWFQPLFQRGLVATSKTTMPVQDTVPNLAPSWFSTFECFTEEWRVDVRSVEDVVRFLVQAGTMAELNELPWQARNDLFDELLTRGHQVKDQYGVDAMFLRQPEQWFRGLVKK
ncbi:class I SAM-dependent methyltransferase [Alicyclobacillus curvatus]|nr:class I SAM-dependent methyltransferase [Alicyclobacillus curvatus]